MLTTPDKEVHDHTADESESSGDNPQAGQNWIRKISKFAPFAVIALALPITLIAMSQRNDIRQRASEGESPASIQSIQTPFKTALSLKSGVRAKSTYPIRIGNTGEALSADAWIKPEYQETDSSTKVLTILENKSTNPTTDTCVSTFKLYAQEQKDNKSTYTLNLYTKAHTLDEITITSTPVQFGAWSHVAFTVNSQNQVSLYVNGKLVETKTLQNNGNFCSHQTYLFVGGENQSDAFNGSIDELRMFNKIVYTSNFDPPTSPYTYDKANPTSNIIGIWHFDGDLKDASVNGNHLSPQGSVQFVESVGSPPFTFGKSLSFTSNSGYIKTPDIKFGVNNEAINGEVWVRPTSPTTAYSAYDIFYAESTDPACNMGFELYIQSQTAGAQNYYPTIRVNYKPTDPNEILTSTGVTAGSGVYGTWMHLAFTVDQNNTIKLFVNGKLAGQKTFNGVKCSNKAKFTIGASSTGTNKFIGEIDEARFSNIVWYTSDFNPQSSPFPSGVSNVLALWHFNDSLADDTANYNHGKLIGNPIEYTTSTIVPANNPAPTAPPPPGITPTVTPTPSPQAVKRIFITSTTYNGNLGGLSGADAKCQERAQAVNLGGTWKAWLSDNITSAASRLSHSTDIYKELNGNVVAGNWTNLTNGQLNYSPPSFDELRNSQRYSEVWTSTIYNGDKITPYSYLSSASQSFCENWTSSLGSYRGGVGLVGSSYSPDWTNYSVASIGRPCNDAKHLYCFEQ